MKKNIIKFLSVLFCVALFMTGCATVGDVFDKNGNSIYFDDIQYNQGHVVQVGDYLYYGNGYTSTESDGFNYDTAQSTGYLSRLDVSKTLDFKDDIKEVNKTNSTPKGVETVANKLIGYQKQNMFALGSYLYFTSANTHKTDKLENDYSQVSLFRVKFNGDDFKEFGTFKNDEKSEIKVTKADDGNYYYVIYAPVTKKDAENKDSEEKSYNIYSIKIGDALGETKLLVEGADSVAICDNDSTFKNVIYSVKSEETEIKTDSVKSVNIASGDIKTLDNGVTGSSIKFLGREGDIVFYSYTYKVVNQVYFKDLANSDNYFNPEQNTNKFHNATEIKNIDKASQGYIFISSSSNSLMYKTLDVTVDATSLLTSSEYSHVLFVDGDYVYYSNDTSISRINVVDLQKEEIVKMTKIVSGECGYTGDYIYFYAQMEELEIDEEDKEDYEEDTNLYMYRTDKQGNYQLIGKTKDYK